MAPPADDTGPDIGRTGARFGGTPRRRREDRATAPAAPDHPVDDAPIGLTGARFGGAGRRRREKARSEDERPRSDELRADEVGADQVAAEQPGSEVTTPPPAPRPVMPPPAAEPAEPSPYTIVRPYVLTGGRTRAGVSFAVEALITATGPGHGGEPVEHTRIRRLCREPRSVAEIAALLGLPLGVAQVLLGDMLATGSVRVHRTADAGGPDQALMERVLAGLRRL